MLRYSALVALSSAIVLALFACDGSNDVDPPANDGGQVDTGAGADTSTPVVDAGSDAPVVPEEGGVSCAPATPETDPTTETCTPVGSCPSCSPTGTRYICQSAPYGAPKAIFEDGGGAGPLGGCQRLVRAPENYFAEYCCSAAWVRRRVDIYDVRKCPAGKPDSYVAPALPDGGGVVALPAGCEPTALDAGTPFAHACCPAL